MQSHKEQLRLDTEKMIDEMYPNPDAKGMSPEAQGDIHQRRYMRDVILENAPCNYLVFGVGNDSLLQHLSNPGGRTVFLEDNPEWIETCRQRWSELSIELVAYNTTPDQWKELLDRPSDLRLELPRHVAEETWRVIFVDAPSGRYVGRMKSIYTASQMAENAGRSDVFLHDTQRKVETAYARKFLKRSRLVKRIRNLEHYAFGLSPVQRIRRRLSG